VVLVAFWASWCEPCAEELRALARLRAAHTAAGRPFEVLLVNLGEGPERAAAFLREHGASGLPVVLDRDGRAAKAWGVGGVPMAFLVDARGRARWSAFGACDWTTGEPARALARLLGSAAPPRGGGAASVLQPGR
jgi:thiol-disulfide isomerase/thioredoxin